MRDLIDRARNWVWSHWSTSINRCTHIHPVTGDRCHLSVAHVARFGTHHRSLGQGKVDYWPPSPLDVPARSDRV